MAEEVKQLSQNRYQQQNNNQRQNKNNQQRGNNQFKPRNNQQNWQNKPPWQNQNNGQNWRNNNSNGNPRFNRFPRANNQYTQSGRPHCSICNRFNHTNSQCWWRNTQMPQVIPYNRMPTAQPMNQTAIPNYPQTNYPQMNQMGYYPNDGTFIQPLMTSQPSTPLHYDDNQQNNQKN